MASFEVRYVYPGQDGERCKVIYQQPLNADLARIEQIFREEERKWRGTVQLSDPIIISIAHVELWD